MARTPPPAGAAHAGDIARFLNRLRPELAASFSAEQLAAMELHFAMRNRVGHVIDWRKHIGFGGLKAYLVVLAGRARAGD